MDQTTEQHYQAALRKAAATIQTLLRRVETLEAAAPGRASEPIAVVGLACRFPGGADSPRQFWRLLRDGDVAITDVPAARWPAAAYLDPDPAAPGKMYTVRGGFLTTPVDTFDARFFGIAPREARALDPQQRLLLELSWEALEQAGLDPTTLHGSQTGVFIGIAGDDYAQLHRHSSQLERIDAYALLGTTFSTAAGRLAYTFGWHGPAVALDTACSSALVAVHLACQSLRAGETELALAGGVNLMLTPATHISFSKLQALSPSGVCRSFDAAADGYVRGEGGGLVVLKRLAEAQRAGDRIWAVLRGSAVNQDGRTQGLAAPNGQAQAAVIRRALATASVAPEAVDYVEAHGTGTVLGDPIEVEALGTVFGGARPQPLWLGTVKPQIGHLEPAAGIAGLIAVVLALQQEELPPTRQVQQLNPYIPWASLPIRVPTTPVPWPRTTRPRLAGVSSFGFSGTNAHVILEEAPAVAPVQRQSTPERPLHILTLSARSPAALNAQVAQYAAHLRDHPEVPLADICFTANTSRARFDHRLVIAAADATEMRARLDSYPTGQPERLVASAVLHDREAPRLAFLFTGQGSQYPGMGALLYQTQPIFRQALDRCAQLLDPILGRTLLDLLFSEGSADLHDTVFTQPALFALEYALAQMWLSWGIQPRAVMGHSVGEYVAACVAGVFGLEDGLRLIAQRGRLMQALPGNGTMVAVFAGVDQVSAALRDGDAVSIAAVNGAADTVISGTPEAVHDVVTRLQVAGVRCQELRVSHAFHSVLMEPMLADYERLVRQVALARPHIPLVSNVTGKLVAGEVTEPSYWCRQIRLPVLFASGMATLRHEGCRAFVEIGPHPVLSGMAGSEGLDEHLCVPSLRKGHPDWAVLAESLSQLYIRGVDVDWSGFDRPYSRGRTTLPTYPFQRERYWVSEGEDVGTRQPSTTSRLVPLLDESEATAIVRQLAASGELTTEELRLLPKLAQQLFRQQREPFTESNDLCYRLVWQAKGRQVENVSPAATPPGTWLVFSESEEPELAQGLREAQKRCMLARPSLAYRRTAANAWTLNADSADDYRRLLEEVAAETTLEGVVYLWSPAVTPESAPDEIGDAGLARVLLLIQALAEGQHSPRLWLVTQGATNADASAPPSPFPALLWGMGRSLFLEHPELKGGLIDVSPGASPGERLALARELVDSQGEDAIAWRGEQRYVPRLTACPLADASVPRLSAEGAYLITGGLGALGLQVARFLAQHGAGCLVLMGRRGPSQAAQATLDFLRQQGAHIVTAQGDCTDETAVRAVLREIEASRFTLKGVMHAAGVADSRAVCDLDHESLRAVLAPKICGAWTLHRLTQHMDLDFFVCFSSVAAVLGSTHMAHYAAANSFLGGFAAYRRGLGLPALTIDWGPWQGGGMSTGAAARRTAEAGFKALPPRRALDVFGRLFGAADPQVAVVDADWPRLRNLYEARRRQPLLEWLDTTVGEEKTADTTSALEELRATPVPDRFDFLVAYLQDRVVDILGFNADTAPDSRQGFFDMGMDSLTAVELKHRLERQLGQPLSRSVAFDYPNIQALAGHLLQLLFPQESAAEPTRHGGRAATGAEVPPSRERVEVQQLSDPQIAALIDAELESLRDKG